jgi:hypothetical protein
MAFDLSHDFVVFDYLTPARGGAAQLDLLMKPLFVVKECLNRF